MFGVADYPAFVVAVIIFLFIPGPGNLALITSTGQAGLRGGLAATLGLIVGDQVLLWLAVAGVAAVLQASPLVFDALQWVGALYLAWLGFRMWRAKPGAGLVIQMRPGRHARQAFLITLLNPKAIMFYMAFFPLFVDPQKHQGLPTFAFMAATIAGLTFLYACGLVLLTRQLADRLRASPRVTRALERACASLLIGFGLKLVLSK
jgi:leucine efflux protein